MRAAAVRDVTKHPDETVVILVPRHNLGDEQVRALHKEHPDADLPPRSGAGGIGTIRIHRNARQQKMCWRAEEAEAMEEALISVESTCASGRIAGQECAARSSRRCAATSGRK